MGNNYCGLVTEITLKYIRLLSPWLIIQSRVGISMALQVQHAF